MTTTIEKLLEKAYELNASDLHVTVGMPPAFRINGQLKMMNSDNIIATEVAEMVTKVIPSDRLNEFKKKKELDFNYVINQNCRFRMHAYFQRNNLTLVAHLIDTKIRTFEELNMPPVLMELSKKMQGLIVITGPSGSGKSTTLTTMIDFINQHQAKHIITLEDPIEYVHTHSKSIVNQREIGRDTESFVSGLRATLRQDADVIVVGEMPDVETVSMAIKAAEAGHLVIASLHTSSVTATIERLIDIFPINQQNQIRIQLANVLQGIISQRLFEREDKKGRIAATEVLVHTPSVSNLIRNNKIHQITTTMQTSRALGMHTLDYSIQQLISLKIIDFEFTKKYLVHMGRSQPAALGE